MEGRKEGGKNGSSEIITCEQKAVCVFLFSLSSQKLGNDSSKSKIVKSYR